MAKQTLDMWINEALNDSDKDGKCTSLALVHIVGGRGEVEIHSTKLGDRAWDCKELATMFRAKAENHAAEIPGVQTFNLLAFYANRNEAQARKPFLVHGEADMSGLATEGPTKDGIIQQCMRHNEAIIQMCFRQTAMLFESTNRTLDRLANTNERLMIESRDSFEIIRSTMMDMATNRDDAAMKQLAYTRATEERKKWLSFGPALINGLLNKEVFPQSVADTALIDSIVDSLSEDDIMKLGSSGIIKPEVWGPLAQRMASSLEKRRHFNEERMQVTRHLDPEDDAAGGTN